MAALQEVLEDRLGPLDRGIVALYWFPTNGLPSALLCNVSSDEVFEKQMVLPAGRNKWLAKEITVRVEFEEGPYRLWVKPSRRAMDELDGRTTGIVAPVVERRTEDTIQTNKQLALIRQSISQVAWGPTSQEDARQIQRRVVDEGVDRVILANKESSEDRKSVV